LRSLSYQQEHDLQEQIQSQLVSWVSTSSLVKQLQEQERQQQVVLGLTQAQQLGQQLALRPGRVPLLVGRVPRLAQQLGQQRLQQVQGPLRLD
jgi:hypothetical protein